MGLCGAQKGSRGSGACNGRRKDSDGSSVPQCPGSVYPEIPAGARDSKTEPTIECAARELEEETGYRCENLEFLISLRTTVAFCNELVDVYAARELIPSHQHLDEGEFIDLEPYTLEELSTLIYQGVIQDAKTVAAIMAYKNKYS